MTDHKKILEIYKSRNNLLDILESINYNVSDYKGFSISEIDTLVRNKQLDMLVTNKDNKKNYIKYFIEKSLRPQNLHDMIDDLFNIEEILDKKDNLIVIIKDEPNETIQKLLSELFVNDNIPNISRFDPVAQVIGIRPGEYCEIIRPSKTSITSKYYRICSN